MTLLKRNRRLVGPWLGAEREVQERGEVRELTEKKRWGRRGDEVGLLLL